jgi:hypothetical protein
MPGTRIHDVEGARRGGPVAEHSLEPACANRLHAAEGGKERDTEPCGCRFIEDVEVGYREAGTELELDRFVSAAET